MNILQTIYTATLSASLTVAFAAVAAVAVNAHREGSWSEGFDGLWDKPTLQAELVDAAYRDQVIDETLKDIVLSSPGAARARIGIIHNGETGPNGMGMLHWDVTHVYASEGHAPGALLMNMALSEWRDILPTLLENKCTTALGNYGLYRERGMPTKTRIACPIMDAKTKHLFGDIAVMFDDKDPQPSTEEIQAIEDRTLIAGEKLAAVLNASRLMQ